MIASPFIATFSLMTSACRSDSILGKVVVLPYYQGSSLTYLWYDHWDLRVRLVMKV